MLKYALILAILPAIAFADRISFTQCQGDYGEWTMPEWAAVEGCNMEACNIPNGTPINISAGFAPQVRADALTTRVRAMWSVLDLDMVLPDEVINGCNAFPNGCPVEVGNTYTLAESFTVSVPFDNINPTIQYSKTNENGEPILCVRTQISLV